MYRPQFVIPPPEGYEDTEFVYEFDGNTVPPLSLPLFPGSQSLNIPLMIEQFQGGELAFLWRAVKVVDPSGYLSIQFEDPNRNLLSDIPLPIDISYGTGDGTRVQGMLPVALEQEIVCPVSSVVRVSISFPL